MAHLSWSCLAKVSQVCHYFEDCKTRDMFESLRISLSCKLKVCVFPCLVSNTLDKVSRLHVFYKFLALRWYDKWNNVALQDVIYNQVMKTGWKPPAKIRKLSEQENDAIRQKFHIIVEGTDLPPPVTAFEDLKLPKCILDELKNKGIKKPTPIQMQVCTSLAWLALPWSVSWIHFRDINCTWKLTDVPPLHNITLIMRRQTCYLATEINSRKCSWFLFDLLQKVLEPIRPVKTSIAICSRVCFHVIYAGRKFLQN